MANSEKVLIGIEKKKKKGRHIRSRYSAILLVQFLFKPARFYVHFF